MVQNINELPLTQINGSSARLSDFAGSVLLIVNVASKCGLTPGRDRTLLMKFEQADRL